MKNGFFFAFSFRHISIIITEKLSEQKTPETYNFLENLKAIFARRRNLGLDRGLSVDDADDRDGPESNGRSAHHLRSVTGHYHAPRLHQ